MFKSLKLSHLKRGLALSLALILCFMMPVSASELSLTDSLTSLFMSGSRSYEGEVYISFDSKAVTTMLSDLAGVSLDELALKDEDSFDEYFYANYDKDNSNSSVKALASSILAADDSTTKEDYLDLRESLCYSASEVVEINELVKKFPYSSASVRYSVATHLPKELNTEVNATVTFYGKDSADNLVIPVHFIVDDSGFLLNTSSLLGSYDLATKLISIYAPEEIDFPVLEAKNLLIERLGNIEYFAYPFVDADINADIDKGLNYVVEQSKIHNTLMNSIISVYADFDSSDYIKKSSSGMSYSLDMLDCEEFIIDLMEYSYKNVSTIVPAVYNALLNYIVDAELLEDATFYSNYELDCVQIAPEYVPEGDVAPTDCMPYIPPTREELVERYSISADELKCVEYCVRGILSISLYVIDNNSVYYNDTLKVLQTNSTYSENCPARSALEFLAPFDSESVKELSGVYTICRNWVKHNFGKSFVRSSIDTNLLKGELSASEEFKFVYGVDVVPIHVVSKVVSKPLSNAVIKVNFGDVTSMHIEDIPELWEYVENTVNPVTDVNLHYVTRQYSDDTYVGYYYTPSYDYMVDFSGEMRTPVSVTRFSDSLDVTQLNFTLQNGSTYVAFEEINSLLRLNCEAVYADEGKWVAVVDANNTTYGSIPAFDLYTFDGLTNWDGNPTLFLKVRDVEKFGYKVDYECVGDYAGFKSKLSSISNGEIFYNIEVYGDEIPLGVVYHNIRIYR